MSDVAPAKKVSVLGIVALVFALVAVVAALAGIVLSVQSKNGEGNVGPEGPQGPPGTSSNTGATGPRGDPGGPVGPEGPEGPEGPKGVAGVAGAPGTNGKDGKNGLDGQNTFTGATGATGPAGQTVYTGPQFSVAYPPISYTGTKFDRSAGAGSAQWSLTRTKLTSGPYSTVGIIDTIFQTSVTLPAGQQLFDVTCKRDGYDYEFRPQGQLLVDSSTNGVAWFYTQTKQNSDGTTTIYLDFPVKYAKVNDQFKNFLIGNGSSGDADATIAATGLTVSVWSLVKVPTERSFNPPPTTRRLLK